MIKTKAIRKIFTTTLTMFIILTIFTIPTTIKKDNILRTNLEIKDITNLSTSNIYLLNEDNLLVKVETFIDGTTIEEKVEKIINYLTTTNNKIPIGLNSYIPQNTRILNQKIENSHLTINFSKEFQNYKKENEKIIITGLVYSLLELKEIKNITLLVEDNYLEGIEQNLDKKIGINNKYLFNSRNGINRVVIYYLENINNNTYYVPVTKYLNDKREKIEIIIDELCNNENTDNLITYLNSNTKLIDYKEENDILFLNFNEYLLDNNEEVNDYNLNSIAYSVFENYDINMVTFNVNNKEIKYLKRN